jgi:hypothetical protein
MPGGTGASMHVWREFLPCAHRTSFEYNGHCAESYKSLVDEMVIGDQSKPADLKRALEHGTFDVIIDDGGHSMEQQITSLVTLFPTLPPGGLYFVEDLQTSFVKYFHDMPSGATTHTFIMHVIAHLHKSWCAENCNIDFDPLPGSKELAALTLAVSCFREVCVLERNGVVIN